MIPQLFIPAARVYSMTDIIPFHLQLSGSLSSIQDFIMPPSQQDAVIRVVLLREVVVETRCKSPLRNILAEGKLSEIPPSTPCEPRDGIHLDWEGEVRCSSNTSVGGFDAGNVTVKVSDLLEIILNCEFTYFDFLGLHPS
jgi:hypothetical protein